jgi:hypothetical protein
VKVVASQNEITDLTTSQIEWDILIKDPKEVHFHPLIENSHPIYWKLKKLAPLQGKLLELQYSGIKKAELKRMMAELGKLMSGQVHKI